jgi:hypothetical protein
LNVFIVGGRKKLRKKVHQNLERGPQNIERDDLQNMHQKGGFIRGGFVKVLKGHFTALKEGLRHIEMGPSK